MDRHVTIAEVLSDSAASPAPGNAYMLSVGYKFLQDSRLWGPIRAFQKLRMFLWSGARTAGGGGIARMGRSTNIRLEKGKVTPANPSMAISNEEKMIQESLERVLVTDPNLGHKRTDFYWMDAGKDKAFAYSRRSFGPKRIAFDESTFQKLADIRFSPTESDVRRRAAQWWSDQIVRHEVSHTRRPAWMLFALGTLLLDVVSYWWIPGAPRLSDNPALWEIQMMSGMLSGILLGIIGGLSICGIVAPLLLDRDDESSQIDADVRAVHQLIDEDKGLLAAVSGIGASLGPKQEQYLTTLTEIAKAEKRYYYDGARAMKRQLLWKTFWSMFRGARTMPAPDHEASTTITVPDTERKVKIIFGTSGWRGLLVRAGSKFKNGKALPKDADGFTPENVGRAAQAIAVIVQQDEIYQSGLPVGVGYDARPGGRAFAVQVVEVLRANGIRVKFVDGVMATPVMAEMTRKELPPDQRFAIGVHLTASHNAVYYSFDEVEAPNGDIQKGAMWMGIKIMRNGTPADDTYTGAIAARANDADNNATYLYKALSEDELTPLRFDAIALANQRLSDAFQFDDPVNGLIAKLNASHHNGHIQQILWNVLHGGTSPQVQRLVEMMEAKGLKVPTEVLNKRTLNEGSIETIEGGHPLRIVNDKGEEEPWGPEPTPKMYKAQMAGKMKAGVTAGIFDGDGDRTEIYDLDGITTLSPNELGVSFAHFLLKTGRVSGNPETLSLVRTLPTTRNLDLLAKFFGLGFHQTPVGSKHFNEYMGSMVTATEESGHIFFRIGDEVFADSAVGEFLLGLLIQAETGKSLKQYYNEDVVADLKTVGNPLIYNRTGVESKYVTNEFKDALKKLRTDNPQDFADALSAKLGKKASVMDATTDKSGILVEFEDGSWAMYRLSGTDGSVRIYGEDTSEEKLRLQEKTVQEVLLELTTPAPARVVVIDMDGAVGVGLLIDRLHAQGFRVVGMTRYMTTSDGGRKLLMQLVDQVIGIELSDAAGVSHFDRNSAYPYLLRKHFGDRLKDVFVVANDDLVLLDGLAGRANLQNAVSRIDQWLTKSRGRGLMPTKKSYKDVRSWFPNISEAVHNALTMLYASISIEERMMIWTASNEEILQQEPEGKRALVGYWLTRALSMAVAAAGVFHYVDTSSPAGLLMGVVLTLIAAVAVSMPVQLILNVLYYVGTGGIGDLYKAWQDHRMVQKAAEAEALALAVRLTQPFYSRLNVHHVVMGASALFLILETTFHIAHGSPVVNANSLRYTAVFLGAA